MMHDHFAVLQQPRRPWLDPQAVQASFLALSTLVHPDRVHNSSADEKSRANQQFTTLNAARQCLLEPRLRVRHLLELERGGPVQQLERLPSAAMDFYFRVGQICQRAGAFLATKPAANSPLLQVRYFQGAMDWREQLEHFQTLLQARRVELENQLMAMNGAWEAAPEIGSAGRTDTLPLEQLEETYRELSYLVRWTEQIRERLLELMI